MGVVVEREEEEASFLRVLVSSNLLPSPLSCFYPSSHEYTRPQDNRGTTPYITA